MSKTASRDDLTRAARRRGIQASYVDADGVRRSVAPATLVAILDLLGDAPAAGPVPAVTLAWDGVLPPTTPPHPRRRGNEVPAFEIVGEDGSALGPVPSPEAGAGAGRREPGSPRLPYGVHEVRSGDEVVGHVISAPSRSSSEPGADRDRAWGVFAPVHALRDVRRLTHGDLTCLEGLGLAIGEMGGASVAMLPLLAELATADGGQQGQSPYSPLSRMFWNEAYLDLARVPELAGTPARGAPSPASRGAARNGGAAPREAQGGAGHADLASVASAMRPALDEAVRRLRRAGGPRLDAFSSYVAQRPELGRYARFRAAVERAGPDLARWPEPWRRGHIDAQEVAADAEQRHLFAQWTMDEQLSAVRETLRSAGVGLLMDLPVGCARAGFDPWAYPGTYVRGASLGAPPDGFFHAGQNWGFPPPHPEIDRRNGYRVLRACLDHGLQHASVLRVDHVLGWSRLWWIPDGADAADGAYVDCRLDEIVAVANLSAWRRSARLVGEDLGTVGRGVRSRLRAHGVAGMRVAIFELGAPVRPRRPTAGTVAYVDTHDTATFAGWLAGADIEQRRRLGLTGDEEAAAEQAQRAEARARALMRLARSRSLVGPAPEGALSDPAPEGALSDPAPEGALTSPAPEGALSDPAPEALVALDALLCELGSSDADLVLATLEDLWAETDPQNIPGTTSEHANFSRLCALGTDELVTDPYVRTILEHLDAARRAPRRRTT